ncbi:lipoyl(octanoyl) transferase LipB [Candidatus Pelagibacter sp.]|nr:lipoyl(octanoyl) transferase LipB [Candidatus Pelagibacter sp.]
MKIQIKKSKKPVEYNKAINFLEQKLTIMKKGDGSDLIWALEHPEVYTGGTSYSKNEILDNSINLIKTKRGGKITYHGPGQSVFYFIIDLNKKKKDIRNFINIIEKTIIETLNEYKINSFSDRDNVGIWVKDKKEIKKIAAIGIRISKWIAFHGFSININNDLNKYKKIIPCGIKDKGITNLNTIKKQDYNQLNNKIINNFIKNLAI